MKKSCLSFLLLSLLLVAGTTARAQTYQVLYSFKGGTDGRVPNGPIFDGAGSLYLSTEDGGSPSQYGTVAKLAPSSGAWKETVLYRFTGGNGGYLPDDTLVFDTTGNLYGTTYFGGTGKCTNGCGTVFELSPSSGGGWQKRVLYSFRGGIHDGSIPHALVFDAAHNLYGTTTSGGANGVGTVFELSPGSTAGSWTERLLYSFRNPPDALNPLSRLVFDSKGNLYGTTWKGGVKGLGTVFELKPAGGGIWNESVIHSFTGRYDGANPLAGLIFDTKGNLYGTTSVGGDFTYAGGLGTVFKLTPSVSSGWTETVIYRMGSPWKGGRFPAGPVVLDAHGNLYGTAAGGKNSSTSCGGTCGVIFKLAPNSNGTWSGAIVYDFLGGNQGGPPYGNLVLGPGGSLYGAANGQVAGTDNGLVYKLTP